MMRNLNAKSKLMALVVLASMGLMGAAVGVGADPPPGPETSELFDNAVRQPLLAETNILDPTVQDRLPPPVGNYLPATKPRGPDRGTSAPDAVTPIWRSTDKVANVCPPSAVNEEKNTNQGSSLTPLITNFRGVGKAPSTDPGDVPPSGDRAKDSGRADTHSAAAKNFIVLTVNHEWAIYNKCGTLVFKSCIEDFLRLTNVGDPPVLVDPRVIYDPWNGRWVMTWQGNKRPQTHLYMVISDDDDPRGDWYYYAFKVAPDNTTFADNYDLGYGVKGVYMAGHQRNFAGGNIAEATFRSFDKAQIYNALPATMVTDSDLKNPDDSPTHSSPTRNPRVAQMQTGPDFDVAFVNARQNGGDRITLWKLSDPFGAHTLKKADFVVAHYDPPLDAVQPGGSKVTTGDCRLTNAVYTNGRLYTANQQKKLWIGDTVARSAVHVYGIDTVSETKVFDAVLGEPGFYYWYGACSMDFSGNVVVNFARTGSAQFLEHRYTSLDLPNNSFFPSLLIKAGEGNFTGNGGPDDTNWGDYFQSSLDWGDYRGGASKQKLWMYGMYAMANPTEWGTWVGSTARSANPGVMTVRPRLPHLPGPQPLNPITGPQGGPFSPSTSAYTLGNSGEVGYNYTVSVAHSQITTPHGFPQDHRTPHWLSAASTYGEVPAGASVDVSFMISAQVANTLPPGDYVATITFKNCYTGATRTQSVTLRVTQATKGGRKLTHSPLVR